LFPAAGFGGQHAAQTQIIGYASVHQMGIRIFAPSSCRSFCRRFRMPGRPRRVGGIHKWPKLSRVSVAAAAAVVVDRYLRQHDGTADDGMIPLTEEHLRKTLRSWLPHYNRADQMLLWGQDFPIRRQIPTYVCTFIGIGSTDQAELSRIPS
jgi:hypothetical protein